MTWAWLNFHLVVEGLHVASVDAKDDVLDQLERIASSPFSPHGVDAHRICVEGKQDRWVAWLAHGYVLTYRPYVAGPPPLARMQMREQTGPVLKMRHGEPMDRKAAARIVTRLARQVGVAKHLTPHSFRHFFITTALDAGIHPREIQQSMGYADMRPITRYDRFDANPARHAANAVEAMVEIA
jgi:site-specific recombinase XerD